MDKKVRQEIEQIIDVLNDIARELDTISYGISREFRGIGQLTCSRSLEDAASQYRQIRDQLRRI
ncbi:hypothetical protein KO561_18825 [Radiobacillus kanasensis]|uniref:hypothetical protein n=1 Tax=Radiobacillus kanasensis TaxID=2844358 RepID=UPI001E49118E|nr:hypothetical protein [Radiobacillus kanasensis]UFT99204.1 hypothetical protein KO561_18825 [Radiobacillus kanasensis]